jgi:ABC-2 type transport system permease protein
MMSIAIRSREPAVLRTVRHRAFHDQRRALAGWSIGVVLLAAWMLAMYPTIRDNAQFADLLDSYPEAMREMFQLDDFTTGPGYLRAEVFSFTAPVLLCLLATLWGSDAIAGEEERGTMDVLLAAPLSRRRLLMDKALAVAAGLVVVTGALGAALGVGGLFVGLHVPASKLVATLLSSAMLAAVFGAVALAIGAATGRRGMSRGITAVVVVAAYIISSLSTIVSWLEPLRPLSPWHHALGVDPLANGFSAANDLT